MSDSIGIVGGGLLGLSLADRLAKQGCQVTVYEAAPSFGGMASAWQLGDVRWDRFYHVILLSDLHTQALLKQLNLSDDFLGVETKTGFYTDGQWHSLSNSLEFLRFPPLGLLSKFRLGLTILRASRIKNWQALERISVVDWLTRWSGQRTVEKIWKPLLKAKLGESYRDASSAFIWATIQRMYAARRSGMKKELFGYVRGGYGRIVDCFIQDLASRGVTLHPGTAVQRIDSPPGVGPTVHLTDGTTKQFDRVICTLAPPLLPHLLPDLTQAEQTKLNAIKYQGIVCASLVLKKPISPYYVTNLTDSWVPFTGVIEMSALVDRVEFNGHSLVYLPKYVASDDPILSEPDASIRERFVSALQRMKPGFTPDDVLAFEVARLKYVFPIPVKNYSQSVPPVTTSLQGVFTVNSSQIVNGTLNVNETLQLAERAMTHLTRENHAAATV